ncbi:uncharacterized protein LOC127595001 [Hippocampus zosterae]|uniref:uncharacterized protein LOC127595001 n=1 Tax=Hippocampus zosterae TaxID=109293 RepID=UPI00223E4318|nr:uncharacterized protein LOC127595001 [Hippocampus zosterae]
MHIREIVLEGFKTYQNRTVVEDFDPQFNAITGENGSGKSNILDAIQFLLGSSNKEMLRFKAGVHELIYKEGHAGVTQASVTITFVLPPDPKDRPLEYESCSELVVSRQVTRDKQKFFINGVTSRLNKVKHLFQSMQLNIDNPHFLIKQGQITHISKMKPLEVLGMIEETAGTSFYNKTKAESEGLIRRKEEKLRAINDVLKSTIVPHLDRLREEKEVYMVWKNGQLALERMTRDVRLYEFCAKERKLQARRQELAAGAQRQEARSGDLQQAAYMLETLTGQLNRLQEERGQVREVKEGRASLRYEERRVAVKNLRVRVGKLETDLGQNQETVFQMDNDLKAVQIKAAFAKEQYEKAAAEEESIAALGHNAEAHEKQLRKAVRETEQELGTLRMKRDYLAQEVQKQTEIRQQFETDKKESRKPLVSTGPLEEEERRLHHLLDGIYAKNFRLKLSYKTPSSPSFSHKQVYGKVMMLLTVKDRSHMRAIEIGAGGKLGNIVVEDEQVSGLLLESRAFSYAVSILPESKMRPNSLSEDLVRQAKAIAEQHKGMAEVAANLITFPDKAARSMQTIFGRWLVCSNEAIARKIAFHQNPALRAKCVTLEGEIIDPSGTMTGGYRHPGEFLLGLCEDAKTALEQLERTELNTFRREEEDLQADCTKVGKYMADLEADLRGNRESLARQEEELTHLQREKEAERRAEDLKKEEKEAQDRLEKGRNEVTRLEEELAGLAKFGQEYGQLDEAAKEAIWEILKKKVNIHYEAGENKLEQQFEDLIEKRKILEGDKHTLYRNMQELDDKRKETLENCYTRVRHSLGLIFSDLLPGAKATLRRLDEDITKGCELEVELNGIKKVLGELSGGQRSLLALSYMLALLQYKPAPFYILDEIDSALDLSHTENIGHMIRNHFPQSQFLLISLKEGMYQNARVLYRVRFHEGESKVERLQNRRKK